MKQNNKQKYCYVLLNKRTDDFLLSDCKLPIYWNKKVAQDECKKFVGFYVSKVLIFELWKHICTYPV